ncbi:hypothetical protein Sru01_26260 [Sphaerisporangium rufum]|uniref:Peptidase inhibitor I9 n=1 Tax=Sphaerisporangium rufum TaxID=1381558 RepID=A0A919R0Z4_9ACTN|nr:S8 family serine peptidase [Sphaerisporangium rufum]GII77644.1 hypothetical protein Sru01_26260 [Sphaerisporangium rufum]
MGVRLTTRFRRAAGWTALVLPWALPAAVVPPAGHADPPERYRVTAAPARADRYIVRLTEDARPASVLSRLGLRPVYVYTKVMNGFAVPLTAQQLTVMLRQPEVTAIESDGVVRAPAAPGPAVRPPAPGAARTAPTTSWGLDRIDQRALPLDGSFRAVHRGAGVTAYVVGTGIDPRGGDLAGRVDPGYSVVADGLGSGDCGGQGTFAAGILGGTRSGVAPAVRLVPVRVLGCGGTGTYSAAIAGLEWIAGNLRRPAVAVLTFSGPESPMLNDAANGLTYLTILLAGGAGDGGADACDTSPGSAAGPLTIAASTETDRPAAFSGRGPCVDVYAPGVDVASAGPGGAVRQGSGTGYAAAYAAGTAALFKDLYGDASSVTVIRWITGNATTGALRDVPAATPNRLLFTDGL